MRPLRIRRRSGVHGHDGRRRRGGGYGHYDGWDDENLGAVYDRNILVRLIPYIAQFKLWATIAIIGMLAATFSSVAMPLFIGLTVDTAIATGNTTRLVWMAGIFFGLVVINAIGLWLQSRYMAKVAHAMLVNIRTQLFGHLQKQSLGFYDKQQVGRLMSRVVSDVEQIQQVMTGGVIGTISDVLTLVGIVAIMLVMDWSLAVVTLSVVPCPNRHFHLLAKAGACGVPACAARNLSCEREFARERFRCARGPEHEP